MVKINIEETNLPFGNMATQSKISRVVIHHVGEPTRDVSAVEIHGWHVTGNGWAGIGYHYLIRENGTIERGRPEKYVGAHASGYNTGSLGIVFAGNMEIMEPTTAQIEMCSLLLADICTRHNIVPTANTVVGHKDLNATACPGKHLYPLLQTIRGKAIWYQQQEAV